MTLGGAAHQRALPPAPSPRWTARAAPDAAIVRILEKELSLPEAMCGVLAGRGFDSDTAAKSFLRPVLDDLFDPALLADATVACERILDAIAGKETILVHGDYDVDGVSAAALLTRWLRTLGGRVVPFVPHRLRDGYDLGTAGVEAARGAGATLLITADTGTRAHAAVDEARRASIDVIVTDHHAPSETLPAALAVVNPRRLDCTYPNEDLSGTGVAFKLCQLLARMTGRAQDELLVLLDLVAVATIADLVPLSGENRILVRYGLRALARSENPGLRALMTVTGLRDPVTSGQIGFILAPRINAVGRMDDAGRALDLLLTDEERTAERLAGELERHNTMRKDEDGRTLEEALDQLARSYDPSRDYGLVLASEDWHPGVIGIVASRVVERLHRPTVLVALRDAGGRGSARSIPGFPLFDAISACQEHLQRFGGHRQAAGMDLAAESVDAFREAFNGEARRRLLGDELRPILVADLEIELGQISDRLVHFLQYLGPHGIGNPRPLFVGRQLSVEGSPRVVGKGHLKVRLRDRSGAVDAIGFGLGERVPPDVLGRSRLDAAFRLGVNEYRGVTTVQAELVDIRSSARPAADSAVLRGEARSLAPAREARPAASS